MRNIVAALTQLSGRLPIVLPLHPRTRKALKELGLLDDLAIRVKLIEPVGYLDMTMLEKHAKLIVTDSGGVQKEAYFQRTACVTLRDETEWTELVDTGWNRLAPPGNLAVMLKNLDQALAKPEGDSQVHLYGDGHSAEKIVKELRLF